jgi:hypothetical protein
MAKTITNHARVKICGYHFLLRSQDSLAALAVQMADLHRASARPVDVPEPHARWLQRH